MSNSPISPQSTSSWRWITAYTLISAISLYLMRFGPASKSAGETMNRLMSSPTSEPFKYPNQPVHIRKNYTGWKPFDMGLSTLVTAFTAGTIGWNENIWVQQANFLVNIFPVIVILSAESVRTNNKRSIIAFTSIWALFYQTVGGAVILPLYTLAFTLKSAKPSYWTPSNLFIPADRARSLLAANTIGYLSPTLAMYYPGLNDHTRMAVVAFWQFSPIVVNVLWALFTPFAKSTSISDSNRGSDTRHPITTLRMAYLVSGSVAALSHFWTIHRLLTSSNVDFTSVFVPKAWKEMPFDLAIHFIFQVDYLFIFLSTTLLALHQIRLVNEVSGREGSNDGRMGVVGMVLAGTVVIGPGAVMAMVWAWRERLIADKVNGKRKSG